MNIIVDGKSVTEASLDTIRDQIHDRWFVLKLVEFDQDEGRVAIRFSEKKEGRSDRELIVEGVARMGIEDEARIGLYDVNEIRFDSTERQLVLTSGFPLKLTMHLRDDWKVRCSDI